MAEAVVTLDMKEWEQFVYGMAGRLKSTAVYLQALCRTMGFANIISHFAEEEGPDGAWPPRAPSTQAAYQAIADGRRKAPRAGVTYSPTNKLLQLSGALLQSVIQAKPEKTGPHSVQVVANVFYSGFHDDPQTGSKMPKRSFMWLSDKTEENMALALLEMIERGDQGGI